MVRMDTVHWLIEVPRSVDNTARIHKRPGTLAIGTRDYGTGKVISKRSMRK